MTREIAVFGVFVPVLLLVFMASFVLQAGVDWLAGRYGWYRHVWHPSLFRIALFICVFCVLGLLTMQPELWS